MRSGMNAGMDGTAVSASESPSVRGPPSPCYAWSREHPMLGFFTFSFSNGCYPVKVFGAPDAATCVVGAFNSRP